MCDGGQVDINVTSVIARKHIEEVILIWQKVLGDRSIGVCVQTTIYEVVGPLVVAEKSLRCRKAMEDSGIRTQELASRTGPYGNSVPAEAPCHEQPGNGYTRSVIRSRVEDGGRCWRVSEPLLWKRDPFHPAVVVTYCGGKSFVKVDVMLARKRANGVPFETKRLCNGNQSEALSFRTGFQKFTYHPVGTAKRQL
ncbi:hypothetical protein FA15DRAFT_652697 [Coprinopsis marcescibilis]|uniref:Uncharacterized protein n=1 Tax=Coprinopsis marcescibilis TaxID=230819 RepID=A0A5C3L7I1_COPMA|nr:hypothetical protein FA15DRAFT_652697 [Coprinopsis marcescibilis]